MKWEKIAFSKLIEFPPKIPLEKGELYDNIPMDVVDGGIKYVQDINQKVYTGGGAKFSNGDTLFARITPCLENGKISKVKGLEKEHGFGSTEFFVFRARPEVSDSDFIYYLAKTDLIRQPAIKSMVGTSGRQRADKGVVENIPVPNISLLTQRRIASILSAYDDLIENNMKRIKLLEEAARCEYRLMMTNEKLEKKSILNICYVTDGTHDSPKQQNEGFYLITGKHLVNGFIDFSSAYCISITDHEKIQKRSKLDNGDVILSNIGTLGNVAFIDYPFEFSVKNVIIFKPSFEIYATYLYCYLQSDEMQTRYKQESSGTSQQFISLKYCRDLTIHLPSEDVLNIFHSTVSKLLKLKSILNQQNSKLREARDILLPRLMNGEVEV